MATKRIAVLRVLIPLVSASTLLGCGGTCYSPEESFLLALGFDDQESPSLDPKVLTARANSYLIGKQLSTFTGDKNLPPFTCAENTTARVDCSYVLKSGMFSEKLFRVAIAAEPSGNISSVVVLDGRR